MVFSVHAAQMWKTHWFGPKKRPLLSLARVRFAIIPGAFFVVRIGTFVVHPPCKAAGITISSLPSFLSFSFLHLNANECDWVRDKRWGNERERERERERGRERGPIGFSLAPSEMEMSPWLCSLSDAYKIQLTSVTKKRRLYCIYVQYSDLILPIVNGRSF